MDEASHKPRTFSYDLILIAVLGAVILIIFVAIPADKTKEYEASLAATYQAQLDDMQNIYEAQATQSASYAATKTAEAERFYASALEWADYAGMLEAGLDTSQQEVAAAQVEIAQLERMMRVEALVAQARLIAETYPQRALLLALEAIQVTEQAGEPRVAAAEQLLRDLLTSIGGTSLGQFNTEIWELTFSQDGHWLAAMDNLYPDRRVILWDFSNLSAVPRFLRGFDAYLSGLTFSPDGRWLAVSSWDGTVRLWEIDKTDQEPVILMPVEARFEGVLFSSDGQRIIAFGKNSVYIWDTHDLSRLPIHLNDLEEEMDIRQAILSPDNRWLAITVEKHIAGDTSYLYAYLVDLNELQIVTKFDLPSTPFWGEYVAFANREQWMLTVLNYNLLQLWDVSGATPALITEYDLVAQASQAYNVGFSPDDQWLIAAGGKAYLWPTNDFLAAPLIVPDVTSFIFSPDGQWLVTDSLFGGSSLSLWDMTMIGPSWQPIILRGHEAGMRGGMRSAVFSPDGEWLVTAGQDKSIRLWSVEAPFPEGKVLFAGERPPIVAASPTSNWLATVDNTDIHLWQTPDSYVGTLFTDTQPIDAIRFSVDGQWFAAAARDGKGYLWATAAWNMPPVVLEHGLSDTWFYPRIFEISPNSQWLLIIIDYEVYLWPISLSTSAPLRLMDFSGEMLSGQIQVATFSPDGRWLATAHGDGKIGLWDMDHLELPPIILEGAFGYSDFLSFSPDGGKLAAANYGDDIRVWDMNNLDQEPLFFVNHGVRDMHFSPTGEWLVTAGLDQTIRLWSLTDQSKNGILYGHNGAVLQLAFTHDERWLVSAGSDNTIRLWSLSSFNEAPVVVHVPYTWCCGSKFVISHDSRWLMATNDTSDKQVLIWRLWLDDLEDVACQIAGRNLTQDEWQRYFPGEPYRLTCAQWPAGENVP